MPTRGIRNNNPGNIRWGADWVGLIDQDQATDKDFCQFKSSQYGIRAIIVILRNYSKRVGSDGVGLANIDTVREVISRWAPPSENNTDAYVDHIAALLHVEPEEHIDLLNLTVICEITKAIIAHENGSNPYTDAEIEAGAKLAGY